MSANTQAARSTPRKDAAADTALDDALENTFPASDPVAMLDPGAPTNLERPIVTPEVSARQAVTGHNVRYVLGWGLAGTVLAFIIVYLAYRF